MPEAIDKWEKMGFKYEGAMLRGRIYQREILDTSSALVVVAYGLSRAIAITLKKWVLTHGNTRYVTSRWGYRNYWVTGQGCRRRWNSQGLARCDWRN